MLRQPVTVADDDEALKHYEKYSSFTSDRQCPCCQDYITYCDEVCVMQVSDAVQEGGRIHITTLQTDDGDFLYEPYILHWGCWEEVIGQIREAKADEPPVECIDGILFCSICQSTIGPHEPYVSTLIAELLVSRRMPDGKKSDQISPNAPTQEPVCLACIVHVFEAHFEDWEELFDDFNTYTEEEEDES